VSSRLPARLLAVAVETMPLLLLPLPPLVDSTLACALSLPPVLAESLSYPSPLQTQIAAAMVAGDLVSELENELPDKV
jgi:hypothetical protein